MVPRNSTPRNPPTRSAPPTSKKVKGDANPADGKATEKEPTGARRRRTIVKTYWDLQLGQLPQGRGGRRPASWRESEITRTKGEARFIIRGHEARIKRGEISLGELAMSQSESDCSSACKRGDLGYFGSAGLAVRRASDGEAYGPQKEAYAEPLCNPSLGHIEVPSRTS
ncbi:peptidyl-prolyl cis-trans isomerase ssp-1 [Apiospora arundinis]